MKIILSKVAITLLSVIALFSTPTFASVITKDLSTLGSKPSPGQLSWSFNADAGFANLDFELAGYRSLDGYDNNYTDIFHLRLNGAEIFTGSFNMGGGGSNKILFNPNGGTALTTTYGATDNIHNSHQVTWSGGVTQISLPIILLSGANKLDFSYTGWAQPSTDESWGVNIASITPSTTSLPESNSYLLLIVGLLGLVTLRRKSF
ncbi:MAG: PEP-CTERM sorting domain-containing protein [Moraxellaceae bacterium]|nr:MAG: PEP-CTERM sorting domain-containing protein [Moraxellaceae bacterium]